MSAAAYLQAGLRAALAALAGLAFAVSLTALAGPASAQSAVGITGAGEGPLEIEADEGIEWRRNEQVYVAIGNAVARRGGVAVHADRLVAHYREREASDSEDGGALGGTEIYRVEAEGSVRIEGESETAYGDQGVYDMDESVVILTGDNLRFVTPDETITARDSLEFWQEKEMAVARGNAVAQQGERTIRAGILTAYLTGVKAESGDGEENAESDDAGSDDGGASIERIEAFENVRITTAEEVATGDKGIYDTQTQVATLFGDVKLTRGQNQLNGGYAEVNLETGVSRLMGGPPDGDARQRVRGLLQPDQASDEQEPGE